MTTQTKNFNSIKVQLERRFCAVSAAPSAYFNSIKVQLEPQLLSLRAALVAISIP